MRKTGRDAGGDALCPVKVCKTVPWTGSRILMLESREQVMMDPSKGWNRRSVIAVVWA